MAFPFRAHRTRQEPTHATPHRRAVAPASARRRRASPPPAVGRGVRRHRHPATGVDVENRTVTVAGGDGIDRLPYDTLRYALGSTAADHGVAGVGEYAFHVASRPAALRLRARLDELGAGGRALVVGGNLTAIEAATEIAGSRPGLRISLATSGEPGGWLGTMARRRDRVGRRLRRPPDRRRQRPHGGDQRPDHGRPSDAVGVAPGRLRHRRERPAVADVVRLGGTDRQAGGGRDHRDIPTIPMSSVGNHISLGRRDAIYQLVDGQAHSPLPPGRRLASWFSGRQPVAVGVDDGLDAVTQAELAQDA